MALPSCKATLSRVNCFSAFRRPGQFLLATCFLIFAKAHVCFAAGASQPAPETPRWSTVDLVKIYNDSPGSSDKLRDPAVLRDTPQVSPDALLNQLVEDAGARAKRLHVELVWDTSGPTLIGISPVLYADPALALPRKNEAARSAAPLRLATVDVAKLYDRHPKVIAGNAALKQEERELQEQLAGMKNAPRRKIDAFQENAREHLRNKLRHQRDEMVADVVTAAVTQARAKGATFVLDISGPDLIGIPNVVYADPKFSLDALSKDGEALPLYKVRTVKVAQLYDNHPATRAFGDFRLKDKETVRAFRDSQLTKITTAVVAYAKRNDIELVIDIDGPTNLGVPTILYADKALDITKKIKF